MLTERFVGSGLRPCAISGNTVTVSRGIVPFCDAAVERDPERKRNVASHEPPAPGQNKYPASAVLSAASAALSAASAAPASADGSHRRRSAFKADAIAGTASCRSTVPMKRNPLRGTVRIRRCVSPVSPIARRALLIQLAIADSDTKRPSQMVCSSSSRVTTRSAFCTRCARRSKTCGSIAKGCDPRHSSRRAASRI